MIVFRLNVTRGGQLSEASLPDISWTKSTLLHSENMV